MDSCLLESEGDTEDEEETDGTVKPLRAPTTGVFNEELQKRLTLRHARRNESPWKCFCLL